MMGFFLFILMNATLFVRPAELVPALVGLPIYNWLTIACLVASATAIMDRVIGLPTVERPVTVCVLGIWTAVVLSHLSHFATYEARVHGVDFLRVVLYYLLLVALIDTAARLRTFLMCLACFIGILSSLSLLDYHGIIDIPTLESASERSSTDDESGGVTFFLQLRSTGIFGDPNDFSLILVVGIVIAFYFLNDPRFGVFRLLWALPLGLFCYAISLTHSRGGFLAMLAAILTIVYFRFGRTRSILLSLVILPAMFVLFAGRQTSISTEDATAQSRIQLWAEGLGLMRTAPVFGIGKGLFGQELGHVAHNSFIHSFTELGFYGGTIFLNIFYLPFRALRQLARHRDQISDPDLRRLQPYMAAILAGYATGILSLSRVYIEPTYMVPGLAVAYIRCAAVGPDLVGLRPDMRLVRRGIIAGAVGLVGGYAFIRLFARWG